MKITKIALLASLATLILALVTTAQAATYRIGVAGVIDHRNDLAGLPSPVIGPIGTPFSMFWYIDDSVVPTTVPGSYVYWQGLVNSSGSVHLLRQALIPIMWEGITMSLSKSIILHQPEVLRTTAWRVPRQAIRLITGISIP